MGKGDIKSKRGKIANGSYGKRRQKKSEAAYTAPVKKEKPAPKAKEEDVPKKEAAKKTAAKKPAAKKAPAKKAAAKK